MDRDPRPPRSSGDTSRRGFLGTVGSAILASRTVSYGRPNAQCHISTSRLVPRAAVFEFEELSVRELQSGMSSGRWTSNALVAGCLARIEALDREGI